jgi:hypothetical protein
LDRKHIVKTDYYGFGKVLKFVSDRSLPWKKTTDHVNIKKLTNDDGGSLRSIETLVSQCTKAYPAERPKSMEAIRNQLHRTIFIHAHISNRPDAAIRCASRKDFKVNNGEPFLR